MSDPKDEFEKSMSNFGDGEGQSLESLFSSESNQLDDIKLDSAKGSRDIALFSKIPVKLTLEVDSVEVMLGDLLDLEPGEVLPLDKKTGEPLDVRVNGQLLARAEVVVVDGRYGLRLTEILDDVSVPSTRK
jgi:flagellar motor switch protein FliN/FliY